MADRPPPVPVPVPCGNCNGAGHKNEIVQTEEHGPQPIQVTCGACGGKGRS